MKLISLTRVLSRKHLSGEVIRFVLGGGINTLLSYAIYWLLLRWLSYPVAYTISYSATIVTGFAINTWFVFRAPWSWRKLAGFPLIQGFNYILGIGTVTICVHYAGVDKLIAPVIATLIVLPVNFMLTRMLILFKKI